MSAETQKSSSPVRRPGHLKLGYMYWANGTHPAGWRYPGAAYEGAFDAEHITKLAQIAEEAKFDFFFFGDRLATGLGYEFTNTSVLARIEPFTAASYIATRTSHIGIVVTANPTYYEPFNLARLVASLDHVTHGRASWNVVTGADGRAAQNYSRPEHGDPNYRYDRADEFIGIVRGLWDSWEDDAFIRNKETGEFVDGSKIHPLDHVGKTFSVKGPLNVARSPQGQPVLLHAGTSDRSREFGAREADVIFAAAATIESGIAYSQDIRRRAATYDRAPEAVSILPGLTPIVGETLEQAREIYDELNALILLDEDIRFGGKGASFWDLSVSRPEVRGEASEMGTRNLGALSQRIGVDVTAIDPDSPITAELVRSFNPTGRYLLAITESRTGRSIGTGRRATLRDLLYSHIVGGHIVVGGPIEIADYLEAWFNAGASDGFNIQSAFVFDQFLKFTGLVLPELRRRGLFRDEYEGKTLREHIGLERPRSRWAA
jgi:FMN-dependent oxidoreductase (nitrilotriacetate monooxygenase family)